MFGGFLDIGAVVVQAVPSAAPPANNSGSLALQSCQWLWGPLCTPDGNAFLGVAGLIAGVVAAGYGVLLHNRATKTAQDNHSRTEQQADIISANIAKTNQITEKSQILLNEVKFISSGIERLLRYRIYDVGEAMAYAAKIIDKVNDECDECLVCAEIYYVNILKNFGIIHENNTKFKSSFELLAKELGLKNWHYALVPTEIARGFHNLRIKSNVKEKSILLKSEKLDDEFFEKLSDIYSEYDFKNNKDNTKRILDQENGDRSRLNVENLIFLDKIDFQLVTAKIVHFSDIEKSIAEKIEYFSLVFFVGNNSLENGQSDPNRKEPIGYYTSDLHYAALDFKVGQWIWDLASTAFRHPVGDSSPSNPVTSASTPPV